MPRKLHYLAYGSNLHPLRLLERAPSAAFVGVVALSGRRVAFGKRGQDGSGKCYLASHCDDEISYGALYALDAKDKALLDAIEGVGKGYRDAQIAVEHDGTTYSSLCYLASRSHVDDALRPFDWYRDLVIAGARYLQLPAHYVETLSAHPVTPDPDSRRAATHAALLRRLHEY